MGNTHGRSSKNRSVGLGGSSFDRYAKCFSWRLPYPRPAAARSRCAAATARAVLASGDMSRLSSKRRVASMIPGRRFTRRPGPPAEADSPGATAVRLELGPRADAESPNDAAAAASGAVLPADRNEYLKCLTACDASSCEWLCGWRAARAVWLPHGATDRGCCAVAEEVASAVPTASPRSTHPSGRRGPRQRGARVVMARHRGRSASQRVTRVSPRHGRAHTRLRRTNQTQQDNAERRERSERSGRKAAVSPVPHRLIDGCGDDAGTPR